MSLLPRKQNFMPNAEIVITKPAFGQTMRADVWWLQPLLVFLGLSTFIVYSTWAAFQGQNYFLGNYISPFYSPELFGGSPHSWFGPKPGWWPQWLLFSPALLVLWAPGGFRLTCSYYRGAYYKAFWADPPACTVGSDRQKFTWHRRRHNCTGHQRLFAGRLHIRVPFPSTSDRRIPRSTCKVASLLSSVRLRGLSKSPAHAVGVAESVLGRLY